FQEQRIRFATFKGATLAMQLYGDISCREFVDIDVIVHQDDLTAAEEALGAQGYRARAGDRFYRDAFLSYQRQYIFETDGATIDLHWEFNTRSAPFPLQAA